MPLHRSKSSLTLILSAPLCMLAVAGCGDSTSVVTGPGTGARGGAGGAGGVGTGAEGGDILNFGGDGGGGGQGEGGAGGVDTTGCGDGEIQPGEVCDDGNSDPGDGCAGDCQAVEQDFACPVPGEACVSTVVCGDGLVTGQETCDDGNINPGDGCSVSCLVEPGWLCQSPGQPCIAAACGDNIIAGNEECEDGDMPPADGNGCSATCQREAGWACGLPGDPCHLTVCNDGLKEGDEPCDDGNDIIGDGCNPFCEVEPDCSMGACISACGDGLILPADNEECDDGNSSDGDGCSSACLIEPGWDCTDVMGQLPPTLEVPAKYRDFIGLPINGGVRHPDFEFYSGSTETPGMVNAILGADGKPVYTGICEAGNQIGPCPYGDQTTSQADFDQWYRDVAGINIYEITKLSLAQQPNGTYYFPDAQFHPLDGLGWVAQGSEAANGGHNFAFTSEIRTYFEFQGDESLSFSGDDDVWVFINGQLALDLGGLHPPVSGSFTLDAATAAALSLTVGNVYEIVLFHAERHTTGSNFNLTLGGFVSAKSSCVTDCGDGIVAGSETCDDGVNDGSYGSCMPDCTPGPRCGDAVLQDPPEECDDGLNYATYSFTGNPECAPGCVLGAYCGDAEINSLFGEECDDGVNAGGYGGCDSDCSFGPHCGDGVIQVAQGEQCDDGNTVSGDGCTDKCKNEGPK